MKQITKNVLCGAALLLSCSCLVALFAPHSTVQASSPAVVQLNAPSAPQGYVDLTVAADRSVDGVVSIKAITKSKTRVEEYKDPMQEMMEQMFGRRFNNNGTQRRQVQTPPRTSAGSGVIISSDGYVVTNNHVVQNADEVEVKLNDGREFKARVVGLDADTDLGLLKIEGEDLQPLVVGNSDDLKIGEWVLAIGNPFMLNSTVTAGIVSAKARSLRSMGSTGVESFIQTDAAINQGNSGGALVNARGELVGINTMLYSQTGSFSGYGFAIPTTIMNKVVSDLKEYGVVQRAVLGVMGYNVGDRVEAEGNEKQEDLGTVTGFYVSEVTKDGTAEAAGLKSGDVIVGMGDKTITKLSELHEALATYSPGESVKITYIRGKKSYTTNAVLKNANKNTEKVKDVNLDLLGAQFRPLTDNMKRYYKVEQGLEVVSVKEGKLQSAGIGKGFVITSVNGKAIKSIEDLESVVRELSKSDNMVMWIDGVDANGNKRNIGIRLN